MSDNKTPKSEQPMTKNEKIVSMVDLGLENFLKGIWPQPPTPENCLDAIRKQSAQIEGLQAKLNMAIRAEQEAVKEKWEIIDQAQKRLVVKDEKVKQLQDENSTLISKKGIPHIKKFYENLAEGNRKYMTDKLKLIEELQAEISKLNEQLKTEIGLKELYSDTLGTLEND